VSRHLAFFIGLAVLFGLGLWFFAEPHELSRTRAEFFAGG
jgi:tellurite resistance protein TerC